MGKWSDQRNGGDAGVHPTSDDLNAYLDGMAGEGEGARIARHVDGCARCREELAGLRATAALLRALPEPRPRRSFQLGPEHARSPESFWDRLGLRLLPALPALRAATVAVALLLVGVTAAEWFEDDQSPASVSQEQAQVAPTATAVSGAGRSAAPAAAEDAPPTSTEPIAPAMAANQPSTADTPRAAAAPTPNPPAPAPAAPGAEVGEAEESEAVTSAEDGADDSAAQEAAAPTAAAAQTFEIAAADEAAAEPETGAEIADGDEAAADTSAASSSNADIRVANDQAALASPPATIEATPAIASPTPAPATPTPAAPATAAAGESRSVSAAPADDSRSGWRLAQIAFAALLACLIALLVIVRRARPRATA